MQVPAATHTLTWDAAQAKVVALHECAIVQMSSEPFGQVLTTVISFQQQSFVQALKMVLWRDEFVRAWQLLIDRKVMKGTACKDGRPTRLQLAVQEWHLRAAFESNVWAHRFTRTFRYIKSHPGRFAKVALGAKNALPPAYIWSKKR